MKKPSPFAHLQAGASGNSLRPKAGLPAEALAKAGGGQGFQPALGPLLHFEIRGVAVSQLASRPATDDQNLAGLG